MGTSGLTLESQLEALIDKNGTDGVLEAMANVCYSKAAHIRENWQDEKRAKIWDKIGTRIWRAISYK